MKSILAATGVPSDWVQGTGQGDRPGYAVKGQFNLARLRPDWKTLQVSGVRPIFDNQVTGPYSDPFPILTGARFVPDLIFNGASEQVLHAWEQRKLNP